MKRRIPAIQSIALATLALLVLLPACPVFANAAVVRTSAQNHSQVRLRPGRTLEVRLQSNPGTGYRWLVDSASTSLLKLEDDSMAPTKPIVGPPRVGAPGTQVLRFRAVAKGMGSLRLRYARSWESPAATDQSFDLQVTVR